MCLEGEQVIFKMTMPSFSDFKESKAFHLFKYLNSTVTCAMA